MRRYYDIDEVVAHVEVLLGLKARHPDQAPVEHGKTIAFIGAKGGVGTSTVALNVAATFASQGTSTTLAEVRNSFGTCALHFGETPHANLCHLLKLPTKEIDAEAIGKVLVTTESGVRVLFGPQAEDELQAIETQQAKAILSELSTTAAYTIIDLPCHMSAATKAAVEASDYVIAVIEHDRLAWTAGKVLLAQIASWTSRKGQHGAVVVKRSPSGRPLKAGESSLELGCDVLGVFPPSEQACENAQHFCAPLVLSQSSTVAATTLTEIANKIKQRIAVPAAV